MDNTTKQKLLSEFHTMKMIEQDAHKFYVSASKSPSVTDLEIRNCCRTIAEDEMHHVELVDRIMNILKNCV